MPNRQKPDESNRQIKIPQELFCNEYWIPDIDQECWQTKGASHQTGADALHCRQLQNKEQRNTLEQRVDEVIRGWEQKTKVHKPHTLHVHEQTMWTNNEDQDSLINHGHNDNYKYMTPHNRSDDVESTLTPSLYSSGYGVGQKATYHDTVLNCWKRQAWTRFICTVPPYVTCGTACHSSPK